MATGSEIIGSHRRTRPKLCESALIGARGYSSKGRPRGATPYVPRRTVTRWDHGSGGVARAHASRIGTGLAVLAVTGTGRPAREHLGQSCGTVLERRDVPVPVRRPAGPAPRATRPPPRRRGGHRRRVGATLPTPEPGDRPGQARRPRVGRARSRCGPPPRHPTHERLEPTPSRSQGTAGRDETAAPATIRRITPVSKEFRNMRFPAPTAVVGHVHCVPGVGTAL